MTAKKLRCAIYTRKSTEEGLEQSFNSLDAQREACAAYILSQAGEGWSALKEMYDDGGFSGGSMERPALARLLADINAGKVDVVVVYKVDRLTRSLADFARIVEIFDRAGASFVSVTQAFNTTTSMGRLTLNVLLSFAQFEREVTGERIRDKFAASKAKGMWMGGHPPLGYDVRERALHVNETEAETVRSIFQRYLEERSVMDLRDALERDGVRSKRWTTRAGREVGGSAITHGALFHILANPIYVGEISHRGKVYPGQHAPIIDRALFEEVAAKLKAGAPALPRTQTRGPKLLLLGKVFDDRGAPMTHAHANKKGLRYFYYVSTAHTRARPAGSLPRVSAPQLEQAVIDAVRPLIAPRHTTSADANLLISAIRRVEVSKHRISIELAPDALDPEDASEALGVIETEDGWRISKSVALGAPDHARRLLSSNCAGAAPRIDRSLVRAVVMARHWSEMLASGERASIEDLARTEGICPIHTGQLLPLAYLAPDLAAAILDGRQPARLTLGALLAEPLPHAWSAQRALFSEFV